MTVRSGTPGTANCFYVELTAVDALTTGTEHHSGRHFNSLSLRDVYSAEKLTWSFRPTALTVLLATGRGPGIDVNQSHGEAHMY
jgi:hypothetical protein